MTNGYKLPVTVPSVTTSDGRQVPVTSDGVLQPLDATQENLLIAMGAEPYASLTVAQLTALAAGLGRGAAAFRPIIAILEDSTGAQHFNNVAPLPGYGNQGWFIVGNELAGSPIKRFINHGGSGQIIAQIMARSPYVAKNDTTVSLAVASIVTVGTTATITTQKPHGWPVNQSLGVPCSITGSAVGAYNLSNAWGTSTGANTFTIQIAAGTANDNASAATLTYTNYGTDVCAVGGGINDALAVATGASVATVQAKLAADLQSYLTAIGDLLSRGILPWILTTMACTNFIGLAAPAGAQITYIVMLNDSLRRLASRLGLPFTDLFQATVDNSSTSLAYKPGFTVDGTHTGNQGGFYGGRPIAEILKQLWPGTPVDLTVSYLDSSAALAPAGVGLGLLQNPALTGTAGAVLGANVSGTVATAWRVRLESGTLTSAACSLIPYPTRKTDFISLKGSVPGSWTTALFYVKDECVLTGGVLYRCAIPHMASVFATDFAAGLWEPAETQGFWQQCVVTGASAGAVLQYAPNVAPGVPVSGMWIFTEGEFEILTSAAAPLVTNKLSGGVSYTTQVQGFTAWATVAGVSSTGVAIPDTVITATRRELKRTLPLLVDSVGGVPASNFSGWEHTFGAGGAAILRWARTQMWNSANPY